MMSTYASDRGEGAFAFRLGTLAVLGLALRALYLFTVGRDLSGTGDWFFYHDQANLLAAGKGFVDSWFGWPSAAHPPLYPLLLSLVSLLGGTSEIAHRSLGMLLGAVTIGLVGLLGRRAGGDRLGLATAAACAVSPLMIAVDGALMSETLYGPMIALALLAAWELQEHPGPRAALASGAAIALAALARAEALLLLPLLAWPLAARAGTGSQRVGLAAQATLGLVLVLAPWTIRNAITLGAFVPISNNNATVIGGANCMRTYSGINTGLWDMRCFSPVRAQSEVEQGAIWRNEGIAYAREHASQLPQVMAVRLLRVWDLWQTGRQTRTGEGRLWQMAVASVGVYFASLGLAVVGALQLRRRRVPLWILLAPAVLVSVTAILGYGLPRLRHAFEIPLLVLAAAGLLRVIDRCRGVAGTATPATGPEP